jgi:quinoprotein glucose dehydrogenase
MADYDRFIPRAQADKDGLYINGDPRRRKTEAGAAMAGTPYGVYWHGFVTGLGIPCQRPPYGFLTAVDLKTGKAIWRRALGDASNSGPLGYALGLPLQLGAPNIGGSLVTRGGVIFIGATQDKHFRAIDEATGKTLLDVALPAGGHATPMTYLGRDGKQYVLIAAGGQPGFGTGVGDSFIAWRLP